MNPHTSTPAQKNISHLTFCGGAESVTGSNFLLEDRAKKVRILVDCGLFQGCKVCEDDNREKFPYEPSSIDILFITHAHIDHVGRIPKLVREGFRGTIVSTPATREIAEIMLADSIGILEKEARADGKSPIYTEEDVAHAMKFWKGISYHTSIEVSGGYRARLLDAGHILGSAMIEITRAGRKMIFTGDLGNSPAPLLRDTEVISDAHYVLMESVYGDRNHESREERKRVLEKVIEDTVKAGGALVIPAFSLERTQELLYELNDLVENNKIPPVPIFLDSPLAIKVTAVYRKSREYFNHAVNEVIKNGDDIFRFPNLHLTEKTEESKAIYNVPNPKIIIAGSGMSNGGRIVHHEKNHLPDPKSTLLLIGYQAVGTPGRLLEEGAKSVRIFGEEIQVAASIVKIRGYSAHKDSDNLQEFIHNTAETVEKVFVAIGEPRASLFLAQRLRDYIGVNAVVPKKSETAELQL